MSNPAALSPCGHIFDYDCIRHEFEVAIIRRCPTCREHVSEVKPRDRGYQLQLLAPTLLEKFPPGVDPRVRGGLAAETERRRLKESVDWHARYHSAFLNINYPESDSDMIVEREMGVDIRQCGLKTITRYSRLFAIGKVPCKALDPNHVHHVDEDSRLEATKAVAENKIKVKFFLPAIETSSREAYYATFTDDFVDERGIHVLMKMKESAYKSRTRYRHMTFIYEVELEETGPAYTKADIDNLERNRCNYTVDPDVREETRKAREEIQGALEWLQRTQQDGSQPYELERAITGLCEPPNGERCAYCPRHHRNGNCKLPGYNPYTGK
ncbi:hypothetical protein B7463_g8615, partial [Scytalidium lignicola]